MMLYRFLAGLILLIPLTAGAVYFPNGIDWTNPSQDRFVQSLYLNMLGRAPGASESQNAVRTLRSNDSRTARLRMFESLLQSSEYQRSFNDTDNSWRVYQAPDFNFNNGDGYYRYQAANSRPDGFANIPGGSRSFTQSIAHSVARYYDAYCYSGNPCIDNPQLARENRASLRNQSNISRSGNNQSNTRANNTRANNNSTHACADSANLTTQYKWVAIDGTTYPRGIGQKTICLEDAYFEANQLNLERYDCDDAYTNCKRNRRLDQRASRSGPDNDGYTSYFFRDGSRLALIKTDQPDTTRNATRDNSVTTQRAPTDPLLADDAHACIDPTQTTSRFSWQTATRSTESTGIGSNTICMDNYYYTVERMTLLRHNCERGFINCRPDPNNNLTANSRKRIDGNPALIFANGTTLVLTARNLAPNTANSRAPATNPPRSRTNTQTQTRTQPNPPTNTQVQPRTRAQTQAQTRASNNRQQQSYSGSDCADSKNRLSQFRWKSQGLSSWPDGIDGKIICLNNAYYEVTRTNIRNYTCQSNYTNCTANPAKNHTISQVSQDGTIWTLDNGDELTLISK